MDLNQQEVPLVRTGFRSTQDYSHSYIKSKEWMNEGTKEERHPAIWANEVLHTHTHIFSNFNFNSNSISK